MQGAPRCIPHPLRFTYDRIDRCRAWLFTPSLVPGARHLINAVG